MSEFKRLAGKALQNIGNAIEKIAQFLDQTLQIIGKGIKRLGQIIGEALKRKGKDMENIKSYASYEDWVSKEQRYENYKKTVRSLIYEKDWETLKSLKEGLKEYPDIVVMIEEALKQRDENHAK